MKQPDIDIIFEDNDLVVISKPPYLLSIPDRYNKNLPSVSEILREKYGEIFVVHRLDKETSGLMMFAKNADAHKLLNDQFQTRSVKKTYWALVKGVSPMEGVIDVNITVHPIKSQMMASLKGGKSATTEYKTINHFKSHSLVEAFPHSGRTHQIRVHLSHIGHEIVCDGIYGTDEPLFLSSFKRKYRQSIEKEERPLLSRLALHSKELSFEHPNTKETLTLGSDLPKDFRAALNQLEKWGK